MTSKPRFSITMDEELLDRVSKFRHTHCISTQSKAVQRLVEIGVQQVEGTKKPNPMNEAGLDYQERELIQMAKTLDPERKRMLLQIAAVVASKDSKDRPCTP